MNIKKIIIELLSIGSLVVFGIVLIKMSDNDTTGLMISIGGMLIIVALIAGAIWIYKMLK